MSPTQPAMAEDLPALLARMLVALVASVALHLGLMQAFSSLPAGKAAPASPPRLSARLAPLPAPEAGATTTPSAGPEPAQIQAASAAAAAARTTAPLPAQSMPPAQRVAGTPEANLITLPAARYLRSNEVDDKPGLATAVTPQYPEAALRAKTGGRIVLRFLINEKGGLDEIAVLEAEPAGVFDESALQAFRNARFVPGKLGGQDVRTQIDLELNYVPGETTTVRTESQMTYGLSVQQIRQGPLALPYRKPASARNLDPKN